MIKAIMKAIAMFVGGIVLFMCYEFVMFLIDGGIWQNFGSFLISQSEMLAPTSSSFSLILALSVAIPFTQYIRDEKPEWKPDFVPFPLLAAFIAVTVITLFSFFRVGIPGLIGAGSILVLILIFGLCFYLINQKGADESEVQTTANGAKEG